MPNFAALRLRFQRKLNHMDPECSSRKVHPRSDSFTPDPSPLRQVYYEQPPRSTNLPNQHNSEFTTLRPSRCPEVAQEAANARILGFGLSHPLSRTQFGLAVQPPTPLVSNNPQSLRSQPLDMLRTTNLASSSSSRRTPLSPPQIEITPANQPSSTPNTWTTPGTSSPSHLSVPSFSESPQRTLPSRSPLSANPNNSHDHDLKTARPHIGKRNPRLRSQHRPSPRRLPATYRPITRFSFDQPSSSTRTASKAPSPPRRSHKAIPGAELELQAWRATLERGGVRRTMWAEERYSVLTDMVDMNRRVVRRARWGGVGSEALGVLGESDQQLVACALAPSVVGVKKEEKRKVRAARKTHWLETVLAPVRWVRAWKMKADEKKATKAEWKEMEDEHGGVAGRG